MFSSFQNIDIPPGQTPAISWVHYSLPPGRRLPSWDFPPWQLCPRGLILVTCLTGFCTVCVLVATPENLIRTNYHVKTSSSKVSSPHATLLPPLVSFSCHKHYCSSQTHLQFCPIRLITPSVAKIPFQGETKTMPTTPILYKLRHESSQVHSREPMSLSGFLIRAEVRDVGDYPPESHT